MKKKLLLILIVPFFLFTGCLTNFLGAKLSADANTYSILNESYRKQYEVSKEDLLEKGKSPVILDYQKDKEKVDEVLSNYYAVGGVTAIGESAEFLYKDLVRSGINDAIKRIAKEKRAHYAVLFKDIKNAHNEISSYEIAFLFPMPEEDRLKLFPGLSVSDLTREKRKEVGVNTGVYVEIAYVNSPCGRAGVKKGDVVIAFAGKTILNTNDYKEALSSIKDGEKRAIIVMRDGEKLTFEVDCKLEYMKKGE